MKLIFNILCILQLFIPQHLFAQNTPQHLFQKKHLPLLNSFANSHQFAQFIINKKPQVASLQNAAHKLIKDTAFKMPTFKIAQGEIQFQFRLTNYKLSHIKGSLFSLNGRTIDLQSENWTSQFSRTTASLWLPDAHALAPLVYYVIYGVVFIVASGCIAMALGSTRSSSEISAKWIRVNRLNFNSAIQEMRNGLKSMGCAANADETVNPIFDYAHFFENYCDHIKNTLASNEAEIRAVRPWFGSLTFEEQRDRYISSHARELGVGYVQNEILQQIPLRTCTDVTCSTRTGTTLYNDLPELDRNIITQFIENEQFVRECVNESLLRSGPTVDTMDSPVESAQ